MAEEVEEKKRKKKDERESFIEGEEEEKKRKIKIRQKQINYINVGEVGACTCHVAFRLFHSAWLILVM